MFAYEYGQMYVAFSRTEFIKLQLVFQVCCFYILSKVGNITWSRLELKARRAYRILKCDSSSHFKVFIQKQAKWVRNKLKLRNERNILFVWSAAW